MLINPLPVLDALLFLVEWQIVAGWCPIPEMLSASPSMISLTRLSLGAVAASTSIFVIYHCSKQLLYPPNPFPSGFDTFILASRAQLSSTTHLFRFLRKHPSTEPFPGIDGLHESIVSFSMVDPSTQSTRHFTPISFVPTIDFIVKRYPFPYGDLSR